MNAILLLAALLGSGEQSEADRVLRCRADRKGRFVVTQQQWKYIREHLTPQKVGALLHPKHGVNRRYVRGTHSTGKSWESRQEILEGLTPERVRRAYEDPINQFYFQLSWFHTSSKLKIRKVDYRTWEIVPEDAWTLGSRRKFGPVHYIRFMRADRRLWLGEYSHTIEME